MSKRNEDEAGAAQALPLSARILLALAQEEHERGGEEPVSLPRLAKMLGASASALMREITLMTDAQIGTQRGPGWVRVHQVETRWLVSLTPAGRAMLGDHHPVGPGGPQPGG